MIHPSISWIEYFSGGSELLSVSLATGDSGGGVGILFPYSLRRVWKFCTILFLSFSATLTDNWMGHALN